MRQTIKSLFLVLLCIGMCSAHALAEETKVVSATPTSGESYYLYNIGTGKFLSTTMSTTSSLASYGLKLTIGSADDGGYTITVASTQKMLYAANTSSAEIDNLGGDETRFSWDFIQQEDGNYRIQCSKGNKNYSANNYLCWKDDQNGVVKLEQTGCLDWAFLTEEAYRAIAYRMPTQNYDFPTVPSSPLVSGSTYYIYNVDARGFIGDRVSILEDPEPVQIELLENGAYSLLLTNTTKGYICYDGHECKTGWYSNPDHSSTKWKIENVGDDVYMIQRSPLATSAYNADEYMGWQSEYSNSVFVNRPQDYGTTWMLIPADEAGNRFVAELKLYQALAKSEAYSDTGWNLSYFTNLYASRSTSTIAEVTEATYGLRNGLKMSTGYKAPYWNEATIFWYTPDGEFGQSAGQTWAFVTGSNDSPTTSGTYFQRGSYSTDISESSLSATVDITEASTFIYEIDGYDNQKLDIYVDGTHVRNLQKMQLGGVRINRFFEDLTEGKHTITFVYNGQNRIKISNIGVMSSPLISVNLLEPGSLGTEVLYNTDHIKNVRRLKIKGEMNDDDWSKVKMMHYLQELDLSEAEIREIPKDQFTCYSDTSSRFLHRMALPEGLEKIGETAYKYSLLDALNFPSTLTSIAKQAFQYSHIQHLDLPDNLTTLGTEVFCGMYWLKELNAPKNMRVIPESTFEGCNALENAVLPDSLETIGKLAFYNCNSMKIEVFPDKLKTIQALAFYKCNALNPIFNDKLEFIGTSAFEQNNGIISLTLPESVTTLSEHAFDGCSSLESVTISSPIWYLNDFVFSNCPKLNTLRLNSSTVVGHTTNANWYPVPANQIANVKLIVPEHLVAAYKLESYWYNFKAIEGFSTEELQSWRINNPLVLNRERLQGNPDIAIVGNHDRLPSLKINGENAQEINDLHFWGSTWENNSYAGQLLSNSDNVKINGTVMTDLETGDKMWHFFCLPYDVKVSGIKPLDETAQMAVRYYDGANRAANGAAGSWKNYAEDDIIPAGTGFIMQTNKWVSNRFTSFNDTKQNVVANREFVKTLDVNASEIPSNKGWNLVGNPWQCFYNDHALNFTAPITVWNTRQRTYTAYSITDDDYAIRPNEAFFVQCPDEANNTIGFPTQGRQLTAVIESQNAARELTAKAADRRLIDIVIGNGDTEDRTRVVLNENATAGYDMTCDAGKMMSMDSQVSQIYTLGEDDVQYAINERPVGNGLIALGYYAGAKGQLTIRLDRCQAERVYLTDYVTNETVDLTAGAYTFSTEAGVNDIRFALGFDTDTETGINTVDKAEQAVPMVYTVDGKFVGNSLEGLKNGVYVVVRAGKSHKMLVK